MESYRRRLLCFCGGIGVSALAGCSTNENSAGVGTTTTTLAEWEKGIPRCETGNYIIEIRGLDVGRDTGPVSINVKNTITQEVDLTVTAIAAELGNTVSVSVDGLEGGDTESLELRDGNAIDGEIISTDSITELRIRIGGISASEQREYDGDVGSRGCR